MMTLGQVLHALTKSNPRIVIMPTRKLESGKVVEVDGMKVGEVNGEKVLILTV